MGDIVKQILAKPIQLADQVSKTADDAQSFKGDCAELKSKCEKLAALLRQAARASSDLYERPTRRIIDDTEQVLDKALQLVIKCRANGIMKRMFTIIPAAAFKKMSSQLENSIGDVSWLLRVSANNDDCDDEYLGLPPIAANEPILCLIWEQIATLYKGTVDERSDAAASLVSLARDNDRYGKLIIEEGGIGPLLKLVKEGKLDGQEHAARAIGLLGRDPESVEHMIHAGVCSVFAKVLKEGPMKVQAMVAWAVSELASNHPKCQDHFAQNNIIRLLVSHLAFETVQEHSKYAVATHSKGMSIHTVVMANNTNSSSTPNANQSNGSLRPTDKLHEEEDKSQIAHPMGNQNPSQIHNVVTNTLANGMVAKTLSKPPLHNSGSHKVSHHSNAKPGSNQGHHHSNGKQSHISLAGTSIKGREFEDPITKANMKAMSAKALWKLAKGNAPICKSITESRALLCFAVLLEKGSEDIQYNSAMALMEISGVAEENADLRKSSFKPNSPAAKAVLDQLLRIVHKADDDLLIPSVKALGHLARTFRATETRIIGPLVKLLDEREGDLTREVAIALTKFACTENYLHVDHCKAIIDAGGVKHLIQLVYFGEQIVQLPALVLVSYIALHVPDSEALAEDAEAEVLTMLEWASKQGAMMQDPSVETLIFEAKSRMELYQSRGSRGLY